MQIEASLRSQEPISGIYYELEDQENVWKLTTSIYVTGKFATEWKNATLPGWYDRIGPEIFMSRHLVSVFFLLFFLSNNKLRTKLISKKSSFIKNLEDGMLVQIREKRFAGFSQVNLKFRVKNNSVFR